MKKLVLFRNVGIAIVLANLSCGPTATFDSPQPYGLKDESSFSKNIQGEYYTADSTGKLIINENLILHEYSEDLESELDSLTTENNTTDTAIKRKQEAVKQQISKVDTVFRIADGFALKKYRGHYFLNWKSSETQKWEVSKLSLEKDLLTIASIRGEEDINKLNEITKTPQDTTVGSVNYDLNKKQFKEFLKSNGFSAIDTFKRVIR